MAETPKRDLTVTFVLEETGEELIGTAAPGDTLAQVAYRTGITLQQTCGGVPSCTDCKCKVVEGVDDGFLPAEGPELRLLGNVYFITRERLACQAVVNGNSKVRVPVRRAKKTKTR